MFTESQTRRGSHRPGYFCRRGGAGVEAARMAREVSVTVATATRIGRLEACLGVVTRETKHAKDSSTLPQARTTQANVSMPESVVCDNDIGAEECRPVHTTVFKTRRSVETFPSCQNKHSDNRAEV
ncbi:hypothetical protein Bbelb_440260 [Branchiostoma belcheri]|nr:hypothetical protein Bbelb_440260 [Branchiostoma belcheri]